ncbi:MAG: hypothetical protein KAI44_10820 [Methylococcales bacterium]|nr:hypothetical protein [Methylococcales bacterium]MCK5479402.1 hypothetical protein [Methylococcales bacterium]
MNTNAQWSGVHTNAGKTRSPDTKISVIVRVDEPLVPIIKSIKEKYSAGVDLKKLESLLTGNNNQDALQEYNSIDLLHENKELKNKINELIIKFNEEHINRITSESKLEKLQKVNHDLVLQRDEENFKAISPKTR